MLSIVVYCVPLLTPGPVEASSKPRRAQSGGARVTRLIGGRTARVAAIKVVALDGPRRGLRRRYPGIKRPAVGRQKAIRRPFVGP